MSDRALPRVTLEPVAHLPLGNSAPAWTEEDPEDADGADTLSELDIMSAQVKPKPKPKRMARSHSLGVRALRAVLGKSDPHAGDEVHSMRKKGGKKPPELQEVQLPPCTLWVGNIPLERAQEASLRAQFLQYGSVKQISVREKPNKDGKHKSWAYVTFEDTDTMIRVAESRVVVHDTQGAIVDLITQIPMADMSSGSGGGASAFIGQQHVERAAAPANARARWSKLSESREASASPSSTSPTTKLFTARVKNALFADGGGVFQVGDVLTERFKRQLAIERHCFFLPNMPFRKTCDVITVLALFYVAVVYPVNEGFSITPAVGSVAFFCDTLVDFWFILDIFLNFRTAIVYGDTQKRDQLEIDQKVIAVRYLKGWFCIDLISCIPVNYITYLTGGADNGGDNLKLLKILRLLRLTRLLKLARFAKILAKYEDTSLRDLLESTRVLVLCIFIFWLTHLLACIWYYTGTIDDEIRFADNKTKLIFGWVKYDFDVSQPYALADVSFTRQYLVAFHAVNPKMFDLKDNHGGEFTNGMLALAIVLELAGVVIFGVLVGKLSHYVTKGKAGEQQYQDTMDSLRDFFRQKNLPYSIRKKVRIFYDNLYVNKTVFDEARLLEPLPPQLSREVIRAMYVDIIKSTPLFRGLQDQSEVVTKLCIHMKTFVVKSGFEIYKEGEVGHEMYIIVSGEVAISKGGNKVHDMKEGACFGDSALLSEGGGSRGTYRTHTARASVDCDLCFLTRHVVFQIMKEFPVLREELAKIGDSRFDPKLARYSAPPAAGFDPQLQAHRTHATAPERASTGAGPSTQAEGHTPGRFSRKWSVKVDDPGSAGSGTSSSASNPRGGARCELRDETARPEQQATATSSPQVGMDGVDLDSLEEELREGPPMPCSLEAQLREGAAGEQEQARGESPPREGGPGPRTALLPHPPPGTRASRESTPTKSETQRYDAVQASQVRLASQVASLQADLRWVIAHLKESKTLT